MSEIDATKKCVTVLLLRNLVLRIWLKIAKIHPNYYPNYAKTTQNRKRKFETLQNIAQLLKKSKNSHKFKKNSHG